MPDHIFFNLQTLIEIYNRGYKAGHHDTVESNYVDINEKDIKEYHEDIVKEIFADIQEENSYNEDCYQYNKTGHSNTHTSGICSECGADSHKNGAPICDCNI